MGLVENVQAHVDRSRRGSVEPSDLFNRGVRPPEPGFEAEDLLALMQRREFKGHDAGVELGRQQGERVGRRHEREVRDALLNGLVVESRSCIARHVAGLQQPLDGKDRRKKAEIVEVGVRALETVLAQLTALSVAAASGAFDVDA